MPMRRLLFVLLLISAPLSAREWIAGEMVIGYPPLYMTAEHPRRGIYSELGQAIFKRAGIDYRINYYNSPRMQRDYWRTRMHLMCCNNPGWWQSDEPWDLSLFSVPVWSIREHWVFPTGFDFDPQTELAGKQLALIAGFGYRGIDDRLITRIDRPGAREIMQALHNHQAEAGILQESVFYWEQQQGDFTLQLGPLQDEIPVHVMVHPSARELMPAINRAIAELKADGTLEAIIQSYHAPPGKKPPPP